MKSVMSMCVLMIVMCLVLQCGLVSIAAAGRRVVLKASDISNKTFPDRSVLRGQIASVQMKHRRRRFADGCSFSLPWSTIRAIRATSAKYQAYCSFPVTLDLGGKKL